MPNDDKALTNLSINELPRTLTIPGNSDLAIYDQAEGRFNRISSTVLAPDAIANVVNVESVSDFPPASGGVITPLPDTDYRIAPYSTINFGTDRIQSADNFSLLGAPGVVVNYTGTGAFFTMTGAGKRFRIRDVGSINCTSGTFLSTTAQLESIILSGTSVACDVIGTNWQANNTNGRQFAFTGYTAGVTFTGTSQNSIIFTSCGFTPNTGSTVTSIDFGVSTSFIVTIRDSLFVIFGATNTGIDGAVSGANLTAGGAGTLDSIRFLGGAGIPYAGITILDVEWAIYDNVGSDVANSIADAGLYIAAGDEASTTISTTDTPVAIAGAWTVDHERLFTSTVGGVCTYTGPNTGAFPLRAQCQVDPATGSNKEYNLYFRKNGTGVELSSRTNVVADAGNPVNIAVNGQIVLANGDTVEMVVEGVSDTTNVTVIGMNFFIN